jgi:hypothetical protein
MRWRKFFTSMLPWKTKHRVQSDGLQQIYDDAITIAALIYKDRPRSRRALAKKLSQKRWTAAYRCLLSVDVVDKKGRLIYEVAPDLETAEWRIRQGLERRRERAQAPSYVSRHDSR